jgi:hypothetical protein
MKILLSLCGALILSQMATLSRKLENLSWHVKSNFLTTRRFNETQITASSLRRPVKMLICLKVNEVTKKIEIFESGKDEGADGRFELARKRKR